MSLAYTPQERHRWWLEMLRLQWLLRTAFASAASKDSESFLRPATLREVRRSTSPSRGWQRECRTRVEILHRFQMKIDTPLNPRRCSLDAPPVLVLGIPLCASSYCTCSR